jgi:hypothetical protein
LVSTKLYKWRRLGSSGTVGMEPEKTRYFSDAWNECISFLPERDKIQFDSGGGCIITWVVKAAMASTLNFLTIDAIFNWPLIENSDQFARQMGIFAKRKIR